MTAGSGRYIPGPNSELAPRLEREIDIIEELAAPARLRQVSEHASAYSGEVRELRDAPQRRAPSLIALGARLQRDHFAELHFKDDARRFSTAAGARPRESAQRRGFGDAHLDGSRHVEHAGLQPDRGSDMFALFEAGNVFEASDGKSLESKRISIGATAASMQRWCAG